jgi:Arc/MetJ-type ribon-helix-helix transcriptional regulator
MFTTNPFQQIKRLISDCALKVKQYLHIDPSDNDVMALHASALTKSLPDPGVEGANQPISLLPTLCSSQTKRRNISFRLADELHRRIGREMQVLSGTRSDFIRVAIERALMDGEQEIGAHRRYVIRGNDKNSCPASTGLEQVPGIAILALKRRKITFRVDDALHQSICRQVPPGRRSEFIRNAIERALKQNAQDRLHDLQAKISWG